MSWRGSCPQQQSYRRGAVGKGGGDGFEPDLRDLVDGERQDIRRQSVPEARQRIDQRRAVRIVMHEHERSLSSGIAIGGEQRAQPAQQGLAGGSA